MCDSVIVFSARPCYSYISPLSSALKVFLRIVQHYENHDDDKNDDDNNQLYFKDI